MSNRDEEYMILQSERLLDLEIALQQYKSILNDMMTEYPEIILKYNERLIKAEEHYTENSKTYKDYKKTKKLD
jgi:hypothetical protein